MLTSVILSPLLIAFVVTVLATPLALIYIKKLGLLDDPKRHIHPAIIHKKPIPRGGGIPLFIGIFIASIFFLPVTKTTIAILIAALISVITGTVDDKYDISRYLRFLINIFCAVIVVAAG